MAEEQIHAPAAVAPAHHPAVKTMTSDRLDEMRKTAYEELFELSETVEDDFEEECEIDRMEEMLEKTMRCGTYADAAKAIRYFVCYMHCVCENEK